MSYLKSVLQPGEVLRFDGTIHWLIFWRAGLALIVAIAVAIFWRAYDPNNQVIPWIALFFLVVAILLFIPPWIKRASTEIAVTDRRIILKQGLIQRHTIEINMDKVESVDVDQTMAGRLLDFGTVTVRGTGIGIEPLRNVSAPIKLRNAVMVHPVIGESGVEAHSPNARL